MYVYKQSYGVPKENGGAEAPTKKKQANPIDFWNNNWVRPQYFIFGVHFIFLRGLTHELNW